MYAIGLRHPGDTDGTPHFHGQAGNGPRDGACRRRSRAGDRRSGARGRGRGRARACIPGHGAGPGT